LIATNPKNTGVMKRAIRWLDAESAHPQAHNLIPALVKAGRAFKLDYYRWVRLEGLGYLRSEIEQDFAALSKA
jgi:hypothetical protein